MGPTYCETPVGPFTFPAEPWNTWSNLVIILYGIAALYLLWKRGAKEYDLYVLALLIIANGVGSLLWHGTRTGWALTFDVLPGLLFLFTFVLLWARRLVGWQWGAAILAAFFFFSQFGSSIASYISVRFFFIGPVVSIVVVGTALAVRTYLKFGRVALHAALIFAIALAALALRTIDQEGCFVFPFGLHFAWHILLSTASFLSVLFLLRLDDLGSKEANVTSA